MNAPSSHFLLFSESNRTNDRGQWRFVLQSIDGADQIEAADVEPNVHGERLELLAVVRGLEALPHPSRVTLVTPSRYVNRGLNYGLAEWRTNDWQWERFGEMAPIKNRDLWQRIDKALEFHSVDCRLWRFDCSEDGGVKKADGASALAGPHFLKRASSSATPPNAEVLESSAAPHRELPLGNIAWPEAEDSSRRNSSKRRYHLFRLISLRRLRCRGGRVLRELAEAVGLRVRQLGTRLVPPPWIS
jgi:ribonuclease HI